MQRPLKPLFIATFRPSVAHHLGFLATNCHLFRNYPPCWSLTRFSLHVILALRHLKILLLFICVRQSCLIYGICVLFRVLLLPRSITLLLYLLLRDDNRLVRV